MRYAACLLLLLATACVAEIPQLEIDPIRPDGGEVTFDVIASMDAPDAAEEIGAHGPVPRSTTDGKFKVYFLPWKVRPRVGGSYYVYEFFAAEMTRPNVYYRVQAHATPIGSFLAKRIETTFHFGASNGRILLPVFCAGRPDFLVVAPLSSPHKVAIARGDVTPTLQNMTGLAIEVKAVPEQAAELAVRLANTDAMTINGGGSRQVPMTVSPSPLGALMATYKPATLGNPHGSIKLKLDSRFSEYPAVELGEIPAAIPLEYTPSLWHLAGTIAAGSFLAWTFCLLVSAITSYRRVRGAFRLVACLVVGILLGWILSIFSAVTGSRLILFGFDLDPTRLPPAFFLGLISGAIGSWYLERFVQYVEGRFDDFFKSGKAKAAGAAAVLVLALFLPARAAAAPTWAAIGGEFKGQMILIDHGGGLWSIPTWAKSVQAAKQIGKISPEFTPTGATVYYKGDYFAAVTSTPRGYSKLPATLHVFDLTHGAGPKEFALGSGLFAGLAADGPGNRLLFVDARMTTLMEASPLPPEHPEVRQIRSLSRLKTIGPMAYDRGMNVVYCADPVAAMVWAFDLNSGKLYRVAGNLGEVRAMCLNRKGTELYIADSARGRLWTIRLDAAHKVEPLAPDVYFKEPNALALDAKGNLWVGDAGGTLYVITPGGQLDRRITH